MNNNEDFFSLSLVDINLILNKKGELEEVKYFSLNSPGESKALMQEKQPLSVLGARALLHKREMIWKQENLKTLKNYAHFHLKSWNPSKRQIQIIDRTLRGLSQKNMAQELSLSVRTVENYMENIKNKLNVSCKAEIIQLVQSKADFFHLYADILEKKLKID